MPPDGWLNDPNGLCQFNGNYHVFIQYMPNTPGPDGRIVKSWGHYAGPDLMHLEFKGVPFWPGELDYNGCYSGSALVEDGKAYLYYTGNIKHPGDYDYITEGRESNTILIETDGEHFGDKQFLFGTKDYPAECTLHVRDPKVWKENDTYYMVQGARMKGGADGDYGSALFYKSHDKKNWELVKIQTTDEAFGYMWECPEYLEVDGHAIMSLCPQGLEHEPYRYQNIYQSGYAPEIGELEDEKQHIGDFVEWDMGFDFYAPQTFVDEQGRRIMFGWAGLPDKPYKNFYADSYWENCLTVPRVLTYRDGVVLQNPVEELNDLRYDEVRLASDEQVILPDGMGDFEINFKNSSAWRVSFAEGTYLSYADGVVSLELSDEEGGGRKIRRAKVAEVRNMRILVDTSILEIYLNDGEYVMTSRFYPSYKGDKHDLKVKFDCDGTEITGWKMHTMVTNINL